MLKKSFHTFSMAVILLLLMSALSATKVLAVDEPTSCSGEVVSLGFPKKLLSINDLSRPGECGVRPTKIIMHTTWGIEDADSLWDYFETHPEGRYASTQFVVGKDGKVLQMLETLRGKVEIGWAVSYYNDDSISIELGNKANYDGKDSVPEVQYNAALSLVKALMTEYGIPLGGIEYDIRNSSNNAGTGNIKKDTLGVFGHYQLSPDDRTDPGDGFLRDFRKDLTGISSTPDDNISPARTPRNDRPSSGSLTSKCVITKIGSPSTSPTPPVECGPVSSQPPSNRPTPSGIFGFPLSAGVGSIDTINTEMASYSGDYSNCMQGVCHAEHAGLDLMTSAGEEVIAVADGQVILSEDPSTCPGVEWGCRVEVLHDDGKMTSAYVHVDPTVGVNAIVKKGDRIGYVHDWPSYDTSMDHLHFELRDDREYNVNPRNYYEELNRFPPAQGYTPSVREHTAQRNLPWVDDGNEFGETFLNHPPCQDGGECWAH